MFKDIIASSIGTGIAEIITLPICTIKTNYQADLKSKNIISITKSIYKKRGLKGFYTASIPSVTSQIISMSTKYTFYHLLKKIRKTEDKDLINNMINGCIGGLIGSIFSHPFDVIKIHQQQNIKFKNELKKNGLKLFYRGYSKSFTKTIGLSCLLFPTYDFYKTNLAYPSFAPICTTFTTILFLQPIDYLKVRNISNLKLYEGLNFFKYYRGIHLNFMRSIPHFMITVNLTEYFIKKMQLA